MWIDYKGKNSEDLGIVVENLPISLIPVRNAKEIIIPGMDGSLDESDDTYANMPYPVLCRATPDCPFELISEWLNGTGDLISSREPNKKYRAWFINRESDSDLFIFLRTTLMFSISPFKYEATPEVITLTSSGVIINPGTRFSLPIITVYGAGTVTINGYSLTVSATAGENFVIVNSEIQECYYDLTTSRNDKVSGLFPIIDPGECAVTLGAGITRIDIDGNWRWF